MPRLLAALALALLASVVASAADADLVKAVLTQQADAWNKGDLDTFLDTYWKSDDLVFFSGGTVSKGHKAVSDRYHKRYKADGKEMGKLTFTALEVEMLGTDAAMVRGKWKLEMKAENPDGLFTLIVKKLPGGWKI
ncbi:MAG: nuclear transport factor 2 family protein, partial [Gemmataceae bacterium]